MLRIAVIAGLILAAVSAGASATPQSTPAEGAPAPPALLNRAMSNTPSTGRTLNVAANGNLEKALDSAKAGDRIVLACGGRYRGNFTLRAKPGTAWTSVVSACATPPEGTRAGPGGQFSKLISPNSSPALAVAPGATRWRLIGLELTSDSTRGSSNGIVDLGDGGATSNAQLPRNIILDRSYVHSWPAQWVHRCIALNADSAAVIDSYLGECHADIDSQVTPSSSRREISSQRRSMHSDSWGARPRRTA